MVELGASRDFDCLFVGVYWVASLIRFVWWFAYVRLRFGIAECFVVGFGMVCGCSLLVWFVTCLFLCFGVVSLGVMRAFTYAYFRWFCVLLL